MQELPYRGFMIRFMRSDIWIALVYPPSALVHSDAFQEKATLEEGELVVLERAKARIDAEIAKREKTSP